MLGCGEDALQKWAWDSNSESKQAGEEGMVLGKGKSCRREDGDFCWEAINTSYLEL